MGINEKARLSGSVAYESGPMDRVPWDSAKDWRDDMDSFLHPLGIGTLNPCNKPSGEQESPTFRKDVQDLKTLGDFDEVTKLMKPICRVDLRMVNKADFLIANIDMDTVMFGTVHEIAIARSIRIPVIVHCKQGKSALPNWIFGVCDHNEMFGTWQEVKDYIYNIHTGKVDPNPKYWHFFDTSHIFGYGDFIEDKEIKVFL
jgi:hypothetical protein